MKYCVYNYLFLYLAQAAVDGVLAASGKPSSSSQQQQQQHHHHHQQSHHAAPAGGGDTGDDGMNQAAAESMLATQNDMLNTVTQLLQQTNSVLKFIEDLSFKTWSVYN
jgi:hypothetical protein